MSVNDFILLVTALGGIEGIKQLVKWWISRKAEKRTVEAQASSEEAESISKYAVEWKELYEKKEQRVNVLDDKVDELYAEIGKYRSMVLQLKEDNAALEIENKKLSYHRCDIKGCTNRRPPSEVMN